jgi:Uma2 family endonuclease
MTAVVRPPARMTVTEFLAWNPGGSQRYELVDGALRSMAPAAIIHGFLQNELGSRLRMHLRAQNSACSVIANPGVVPRLMPDHNVRIPDLGVTCSPLAPTQTTLADPVLLVEILSPSNQPKTWSNVWAYTSIPSVRELLVLHTSRVAAESLRKADDGSWPQRFEPAADGMLVLETLGFQVPLAELYEGTGLAG